MLCLLGASEHSSLMPLLSVSRMSSRMTGGADLRWTSPKDQPRIRTYGSDFPMLEKYCILIDSIFPRGWETKPFKEHPALRRYRVCSDIIRQGHSVVLPQQLPEISEVGGAILDVQALLETSGPNEPRRQEADFALLGSSKARQVLARLTKPDQYAATMAELDVAAYHLLRGRQVIADEGPGQPDFIVRDPKWDRPLVLEVKHVGTPSLPRVEKAIRLARRQLRAHKGIAWRVAVIGTDQPGRYIEGEQALIPSGIAQRVEQIARAARIRRLGGVHAIVFLWNEIRWQIPSSGEFRFSLVRRQLTACFEEDGESLPNEVVPYEDHEAQWYLSRHRGSLGD